MRVRIYQSAADMSTCQNKEVGIQVKFDQHTDSSVVSGLRERIDCFRSAATQIINETEIDRSHTLDSGAKSELQILIQ